MDFSASIRITGQNIYERAQSVLTLVQGKLSTEVLGVSPPSHASAKSLVFCSKPDHLQQALAQKAPLLIVLDKLTLEDLPADVLVFGTKNIPLAMAHVLPLFDQKKLRFSTEAQIHPTAVIHPSARLGQNLRIEAFVVIGAEAVIGDNSTLGTHCVVERKAKIGSSTLLHSHVFIGSECEIGSFCEIHPHTTIGSDGFGFATDSNFKHHKIPQLGKVIIEDHVEIGANCTFDRATLTETRIKSGTKFDNLCHVAHNCEIGENSLIAAGFFVAGSTKIGARLMTAGNVAVTSHVKLTDGVTLGGRATVTNDIKEPGVYAGYPLQPLKEALRTMTSATHVTELRRQVSKILKHLNLSND